MTSEERLIAYVDGELDATARTAFEAEMIADPALAAAVAAHRGMSARIGDAYAPVLAEPVPPHLVALATAANDRGPRFGAPQWAAMAACLVVGVLASHAAWPPGGPIAARGDRLVARGELASALTTRLAAEAGPVRVGLSFRDGEGRYCRTFQSAPDRLAGLACHEDGLWVARLTSAWNPPAAVGYRTAASDTPPEVLAAVDRLIAGDPLDAAAEQAARGRNWEP